MPYWNAGIVHVDHVPSGKFAGDFWEGSDCKLLGKFDHDRTLISRTLGIMVFIFGKSSPFKGRKIQVSELLFHLPRIMYCIIMWIIVNSYSGPLQLYCKYHLPRKKRSSTRAVPCFADNDLIDFTGNRASLENLYRMGAPSDVFTLVYKPWNNHHELVRYIYHKP